MSEPPELPDEDAPWADGPGHLSGEDLPLPEEVAALEDLPPEDEVPPSPS
ncbi:hypothetical protein ACUN7V_05345 [Quadrisphaera oryzae]|nr:hypothetical protein [Quadrisphaera sp. RL12-1S]MBC3762949.1 hypothetical protein [Quadrisphaera sp. RL12-1S]